MVQLSYFILFAALWSTGNGILHNFFVLKKGLPYDRELIRLLIDGHILIFAGIFYALTFKGIKQGEALAYWIAIGVSIFLLGYCALIFKLIPSIGMIGVNLIALIWLVILKFK